eukprot:2558741-Amphidinium_carterae.1
MDGGVDRPILPPNSFGGTQGKAAMYLKKWGNDWCCKSTRKVSGSTGHKASMMQHSLSDAMPFLGHAYAQFHSPRCNPSLMPNPFQLFKPVVTPNRTAGYHRIGEFVHSSLGCCGASNHDQDSGDHRSKH